MLLTITYTGKQTQDLGYLLHKDPRRAQSFALSFGKAYVFYPEVSDARTTAALLLDIDPLDLARGKTGAGAGGLFDYVNDRPYVASSFMSTALSRVFGTAMKGKCSKMQALADTPLHLTACVHMLPCRGDESLPAEVFEPLGYDVSWTRPMLDERFPEWGDCPYIDLTLRGTLTLCALLNHLYVLIPVFDKQRHYYVKEDDIEKLLQHGEGWLASHPAREKIIKRYYSMRRSYAYKAIDRLLESEGIASEADDSTAEKNRQAKLSLQSERLESVKNAVLESGAASVIDLGCGECGLAAMLLDEKQIRRITAVDVAVDVLERAKRRLRYDDMPPFKKDRLTLMQASLTYKDPRFAGYDAACVVEVVEHFDPQRIAALERVLFECAAPHTVVLTTPNRDYNALYGGLAENRLRHEDHRFEWTRNEFEAWTEHICKSFGYTVVISGVGAADAACGSPTQMGVFTKCV